MTEDYIKRTLPVGFPVIFQKNLITRNHNLMDVCLNIYIYFRTAITFVLQTFQIILLTSMNTHV
jgi:hypothetical protein